MTTTTTTMPILTIKRRRISSSSSGREKYIARVCVYLSLNVFTLNKSDGISPKHIHISTSESANIPRSTHTAIRDDDSDDVFFLLFVVFAVL